MPMPMPGKDESQDVFMGRCMKMMHDENMNKPEGKRREQKQMVAMCFSQWRKKDSKAEDTETEQEIVEASNQFVAEFLKKHPEYKEKLKKKKEKSY